MPRAINPKRAAPIMQRPKRHAADARARARMLVLAQRRKKVRAVISTAPRELAAPEPVRLHFRLFVPLTSSGARTYILPPGHFLFFFFFFFLSWLRVDDRKRARARLSTLQLTSKSASARL